MPITEDDIDWHLCVPCAAITCTTTEEAQRALATLAACDDYQAGAIITLEERPTAVAYTNGHIPKLPDVTRIWLAGRVAKQHGLPNPLRMSPPGADYRRKAPVKAPKAPPAPLHAESTPAKPAPPSRKAANATDAPAQMTLF